MGKEERAKAILLVKLKEETFMVHLQLHVQSARQVTLSKVVFSEILSRWRLRLQTNLPK
jgi:hypothetical protein